MDNNWTDEDLADLAWRQVITVMEAIVPPEVFRPAQAHCWKHNPALPSTESLAATMHSFPNDAAFRDWVRTGASHEEVFALWSAIGELNRAIYLLDEGESAPRDIVEAVRESPAARAIFCLALRRWQPRNEL